VNTRQLQHLAAAMAHEVRNPLNSLAIHLELLDKKLRKEGLSPQDRESAQRSLDVMQSEVERIDRILEEYLQFAGPTEAARAPVDAAQLIAEAVKRVKPEAERGGVGIEVRTDGSLGEWAVDAPALGEALEAVLENAVQASRAGQMVELVARTRDDHAEIDVIDRGEGLHAEELKRVFQIGFSKHDRDGLGLTVAKQIVKGHGGAISGASDGPGLGATFRLRVPLELDLDATVE
jgi:signal transduction histidine kinase